MICYLSSLSVLIYLSVGLFVCSSPVQLIIDTDLGFDVDDVGAIAVGNYFQDIGEAEILAVIHNTAFYKGIGGVDVINHWYDRFDLELGGYRGQWGSSDDAQDAQDSYTSSIERDYPSDIQNYDQVLDEVSAYKKALSGADNNTVVVVSIGEPLAIRNILQAEYDLFVSKVREVHYMDGGYNFGCGDSDGSEWSPWLGSTEDCDGAAQYVVDHIPSSIRQYFSLNGENILTGSRFQEGCGSGPVKEAYQLWTNYGSRPSWDLISVYMAIRGVESLYSTAYAGTNNVDYYGHEDFDVTDTENNQYQVWIDDSHYGDVVRILDDIICANPCKSSEKVGGCAGYILNSGSNCWSDHGADDIDSSEPCGIFSLSECQQWCDKTDGCDGVVVTAAHDGLVECYRKANINLIECDLYWPFDTYVKT
eukprot:CAMPEP_0185021796 /NCGR_PEP_ID=MMETSP1103-20130426/4504_1 /TAXON_ID=36769 /ORGANISM="Paraphysomonas bandaiensis, Strain Caron Lab Isolate" /LENGTH=419 /DNA_ID=CAMNT_0027553539 /DNA_START=34 /DNA_END=1293 /DNA_ORIENTATION=-